MASQGKPIPAGKRFFKIHELVGDRWPAVTEEFLFNWADERTYYPVTTEGVRKLAAIRGEETERILELLKSSPNLETLRGEVEIDQFCERMREELEKDTTYDLKAGLVNTDPGHYWNDPDHGGVVFLLSFWKFFPDFISIVPLDSTEDTPEDSPEERMGKMIAKGSGGPLFYGKHLQNQFLMLNNDDTKGFAYNISEKAKCLRFYDENGMIHFIGVLAGNPIRYQLEQIEIHKDELLVKAENVALLEKLFPGLTDGTYPENAHSSSPEQATSHQPSANADGEKPLVGQKELAAFMGVSVRTIKDRVKEKGFPIWRNRGRYYSYPSALNDYIRKKK